MKSIQVFDPALCCSTGVCGVDVDQALVTFAADVSWANQNGVAVERFNLAQQPLAFAQNQTVKEILEQSGQNALPLILVDGVVALAGRYPSRAELTKLGGFLDKLYRGFDPIHAAVGGLTKVQVCCEPGTDDDGKPASKCC